VLAEGEVRVWRVNLDSLRIDSLPEASAEERERAARFVTDVLRDRYLRSHRALRAVLSSLTTAPLLFAAHERGKPYLSAAPELRFNLSHSDSMALIGAALGVEVGVDIERVRHIPQVEAIAERFFPPSEAATMPANADEREFFRRWTRIEAMLKATGDGLYGTGQEIPGDWTVQEIEAPDGFAASVAAACSGMKIVIADIQ
jgi:4'-phosphopantetheinyl transferase